MTDSQIKLISWLIAIGCGLAALVIAVLSALISLTAALLILLTIIGTCALIRALK